MERFVIRQNIEHYRALWEITTDLQRRAVIERLLLEEEVKLKKILRRSQEEPARLWQDGLIWLLLFELLGAGPPTSSLAIPAALIGNQYRRRPTPVIRRLVRFRCRVQRFSDSQYSMNSKSSGCMPYTCRGRPLASLRKGVSSWSGNEQDEELAHDEVCYFWQPWRSAS